MGKITLSVIKADVGGWVGHCASHPDMLALAAKIIKAAVERFFRTLKEQAVYGRIFNNLEEVRATVAAFVGTYNEDWRLEKLGFLSPIEYRRTYLQKRAA